MVRPLKRSPLRTASNIPWTLLLVLLVPLVSSAHAQWTQFGGPRQEFRIDDAGIAEKWPDNGPGQIWTRKLGGGHAAILAEEDHLYTMYCDGKQEVVISLDAKTGKTLWEYKYEFVLLKGIDPEFGKGPNATPLLTDGRLYTISIAGLMHCLDAKTGDALWSHNLWTGYKGKLVEFGHSSSPIGYKDMVIALMGGDAQSIVAFDKRDGHVVWKALSFPLSYSTPKIMRLGGEDHLVVYMASALIGVDPNTGRLRWNYPLENQWKQNITMPTQLDDDRLFASTLEAGSRCLKLVKDGEFRVEEVWSKRQPQYFFVSSVRMGDYIYGSSGDHTSSYMSAVNIRTGKLAWRTRGFSLANVVGVGDRLIILDGDGTLALATPSPEGLVVHSKVKLLDTPSWTAPTIVGKTLYIRDMHKIMALDLG